MRDEVQAHVPGFDRLRLLTRDGRGDLYEARDTEHDKLVFVRVFSRDLSASRRFEVELENARCLADEILHPGILRILEVGAHAGRRYAAMEHTSGCSLGDWLRRKKHFREADALAVAESVASALSIAWRRSAASHGALSIETVWVEEGGSVKVGDLVGISWTACHADSLADAYPSPEQVHGKQVVDCRSDIYSLGAMMSHLLTGRHPADRETPRADGGTEKEAAAEEKEPPFVSNAVSRLIEYMTASKRERRYPDWPRVLEDIRRVKAGALPYAVVPETWRRGDTGKYDAVSAAGSVATLPATIRMRPSQRPRGRRLGGAWYRRGLWAAASLLLLLTAVLVRREMHTPVPHTDEPPVPAKRSAALASPPPVAEETPMPELPPAAPLPADAAPEVIPAPTVLEPDTPQPLEPPPRGATQPVADTTPKPALPPPAPPEGYLDYVAVSTGAQWCARERQYAAARTSLEIWGLRHPDHPWRDRVERDARQLRMVTDLFQLPERAPERIAGVAIRARNDIVGQIETVRDGVITVGWALPDGNARFHVSVAELSDGDLARVLDAADPRHYPLNVARYLTARGAYDKALAWCAEAEDAGLDVTGTREWARRWQGAERNGRAAALLERVTKLVNGKRFEEAERSLRVGQAAFADSTVFTQVRPALVRALNERIAAGLAAARKGGKHRPELPQEVLTSRRIPPSLARLEQMTRVANARGAWVQHKAAADELLAKAVGRSGLSRSGSAVNGILENELTALLLAQSAFIRAVTPDRLAPLVAEDRTGHGLEFLDWLFIHEGAMAAYLVSVKPEDDVNRVLSLWVELYAEDPEAYDAYYNLALACALVFDRPVRGVDVHERYRFYLESDRKHRLRVSLPRLTARELVWVVDPAIATSELAWAQKHVNLAQRQWERTYSMVQYRMERAVSGEQLYDDYTLENILREGGICSDQAYFATMTAKANGIPAMTIVGRGQRGGHAWFAYKSAPKEWNMTAGRYNADLYRDGTTRDPQTGRQLTEHEVKLMADPKAGTPEYARATRLLWLGRLLADRNASGQALSSFEMALETAPRHIDALLTYVEYLKRLGASDEKWEEIIRRMRTEFRDYPDVTHLADEMEVEYVSRTKGALEAAKNIRRQTRRLGHQHGDRTDLIIDSVSLRIDLLLKAGDKEGVSTAYYDALRDYGREVEPFKTLANAYFDFASGAGMQEEAMRRIESIFRRYHPEPGGDYFRMVTHAGLMNMMASLLERDGQDSKADRLRRKAERLSERARERYD